MKKRIFSLIFATICVLACGLCLTACGNRTVWTAPKRVSLTLPEKLHVEYRNSSIGGDATLPSYCVLVKDGDLYYVKTPHKYYSSNRLEVFEKINLQNAVVFDAPIYSQGYISARWDDYNSCWVSAADDVNESPNAPQWHANDKNNSVFWTGYDFLDSGYGDVNHPYDNGVTDKNGYTHTATQLANEIVTLQSGQTVECVVWEYSFTTSDPNNWSREKFWFEAQTGVTIKKSSIYPSSQYQNLNNENNVGLYATYFSTNETMESYLTSANRGPAPDFSSYR